MNNESIQDVINDVCGLTEKNERKSAVSIHIDKCNIKEGQQNIIPQAKYTTLKAEVQISSVNEKYILMDFIFSSASDPELKMMWNLLNRPIDILEDENTVTLKHITLTPVQFKGFYINAVAPIFMALQPSDISQSCNSIRVLFEAEYVDFYYTDEIDSKQIEDEVKAEEQSRIELENRMAERRLAHEQYGQTATDETAPDDFDNPNIIRIE